MPIEFRGPEETEKEFNLVEDSEAVLESMVWPELEAIINKKKKELGAEVVDRLIMVQVAKIKSNPRYVDFPEPRIITMIFNQPVNGSSGNEFDYADHEVQTFIENELVNIKKETLASN